MKNKSICILLAVMSFVSFAQNPANDYGKMWKKVDAYIKDQLPASALEMLDDIDALAVDNNDDIQRVKVNIYKSVVNDLYSYDSDKLSVLSFDSLAENSAFPIKNIYYSLAAEQYMNYYNRNRYSLGNNVTLSELNNDISTWSRENFVKYASEYYLKSLENANLLKKIPIQDVADILKPDTSFLSLCPSLFDLLAHRAIDFFSSSVNQLMSPNFVSMKALMPVHDFVNLVIDSSISDSEVVINVLSLYQSLLKTNMESPHVLAYTDISRLNFAKIYVSDDSDVAYLSAMEALKFLLDESDAMTEVFYQLADFYQSKGDSMKDNLVKAVDYCKQAIELYPNARATALCTRMMNEIEESKLEIVEYQDVVYPNEYFTVLVNYKNTKNLSFRIVEVGDKDFFQYSNSLKLEDLLKKDAVVEWSEMVTSSGDYKSHSVEVAISHLNKGRYAMIIANDDSFDIDKCSVAYYVFQVTDLNLIMSKNHDNDLEIYAVNRNSSAPINKCDLNLYQYNNRTRTFESYKSYSTDKNGKCVIPSDVFAGDYKRFKLEVVKKGKWLFNDEISMYSYGRGSSEKNSFVTYYLDRAIYRPGQTVYFKGILMSRDGDLNKIVPNTSVTLTLKDANYQEVDEVVLKTNEFGSFAGSFVIPDDGLTGYYSISSNFRSSVNFSVEDYRRPTFEISFENKMSQPKPNAGVDVEVSAVTYAGEALANSTVKYKVVRNTSYFRYFWGAPSVNNVNVASGVLTTDDEGRALINFVAKCPTDKNKRNGALYSFVIQVDVTNPTGETISSEHRVAVSDQTIAIKSNVGDIVNTSSDTIKIWAENLYGEKQDATFDVKIVKLVEPKRLSRTRLWNAPEYYTESETFYNKHLPLDCYKNVTIEGLAKNNPPVFALSTDGNLNVTKKLVPGFYCMSVATKDDYGVTVNDSLYFRVINDNSFVFLNNEVKLLTNKNSAKIGEDVRISIVSSKNVYARVRVASHGRVIFDDFVKISGRYNIPITVTSEDVSGISVSVSSAFDNRSFTLYEEIAVPFEDKNLDVRLLTERSNLLPAGFEKWAVSIKDISGKAVDAELLATMYDMSLDYFVTSYYSLPSWGHFVNNNNLTFVDYDVMSHAAYGRSNKRIDYVNCNEIVFPSIDWHNLFGNYYRTEDVRYYNSISAEKGSSANLTNVMYDGVAEEEVAVEGVSFSENKQNVKSIRRDFKETAFFYPQLKSSENGEVTFEFVVPESITKWKFRAVAHTKDLASGILEQEFVAKKDLYISVNAPKLLYNNDVIVYTANIFNNLDSNISCKSNITVFDDKNVDITADVVDVMSKSLSVKGISSQIVCWTLTVPEDVAFLTIRTAVDADGISDAEEILIPVLSTKTLVVETLPITLKNSGKNSFTFDDFKKKFGKKSIDSKLFMLEYSANPAWYVIQTLPYMQSDNSEFIDNVFASVYSNLIAKYIVDNNPEIEQVYKQLKAVAPDALESKLDKNQEVKDILLNESSWVMDAADEKSQQLNMAKLFDANTLNYSLKHNISLLGEMQRGDGGFPWIKGGRYSSVFVTSNVMNGFAHLMDLNIIDIEKDRSVFNIVRSAMAYLDKEFIDDYKNLKKRNQLESYTISNYDINYLYVRMKFADVVDANDEVNELVDFYFKKLSKGWQNRSLYMQSISTLLLSENGYEKVAATIMKSFDERALHNEELGMYWRDLTDGYSCNAVVTMASMIECYAKLSADKNAVSEMKRWLINQKRTTMWDTYVASVDAVYALLLGEGVNIAGDFADDVIAVGNQTITCKDALPGSGYVKKSWSNGEINKSFSEIKIDKKSEGTSWTSVYWKYLADYKDVTSSSSGLSVKRSVLKAEYVDGVEKFVEVTPDAELNSTDKVIVRLIVSTDRDMEFVHLKDVLPACFIPKEVLSGYGYSGGLYYYMSIKDESVNYFIETMNRGVYVVDYEVNIQQSGTFNSGISTIQSYYAPEFSGKSSGITIIIR